MLKFIIKKFLEVSSPSLGVSERIPKNYGKFNTILMKIEKIEVLQFIRWCKTVKNIYKKLKGYEYIINNKHLI